jgi:23S rRNA (pseudouridine1915-N3)-methyltransferase
MKLLFLFGGGKYSKEAEPLALAYKTKLARDCTVEEKLIDSKGKTPDELRKGESAAMLVVLKSTDFLITFDERGKKMSSEKFADLLNKAQLDGKRVVVAVGGAWGMTDDVRHRASAVVAFSDMIFPHDMARIMAMEQVYRGIQIHKSSPYHHA